MWFVMVTFSTVGYGDIYPTIWISKLMVIVVLLCAFSILPGQIEELVYIWRRQQATGGEYSEQRARNERHVVLCATELRMDVIIDFLNEFYAYPNLQDYFVVLLTPVELCGSLKRFLEIPVWMHRVVYLQGSALNDIDLMRAKVNDAEACFVLTSRSELDRKAADEKTVLRAMAIKDCAPYCPLYVQLLQPEAKFHVKFADQVICDEEFKYALLALNCDIPGISTAIVLLSHTTQEMEDDDLDCEWKKQINQSINSEIYDVQAEKSKFFGDHIGNSFNIAAYTAYKKYGALLIGVSRNGKILLNPGEKFIISGQDILFYICNSSEDNAIINQCDQVSKDAPRESFLTSTTNNLVRQTEFDKNESSASWEPETHTKQWDPEMVEEHTWMLDCLAGFPPLCPYLGYTNPTMCYITEKPRAPSEMRLHSKNETFIWSYEPILVLCREMTASLFNLIVPLRAHSRAPSKINPVIILTSLEPETPVLEGLSSFPLIYYLVGDMSNIDDLLSAGIIHAQAVLVFADTEKEVQIGSLGVECAEEDEHLADRAQVVDCLQLERMFPEIRLIMELTHISNLRFLQFKYWKTENATSLVNQESCAGVKDRAKYLQEKFGETKKEVRHANMPYLFREAFATGKAFSTSMLDTLVYQSFIKPYLPDLLKLMLGLCYSQGSGNLSTIVITKEQHGIKFSSLFYQICVFEMNFLFFKITINYLKKMKDFRKFLSRIIGCYSVRNIQENGLFCT